MMKRSASDMMPATLEAAHYIYPQSFAEADISHHSWNSDARYTQCTNSDYVTDTHYKNSTQSWLGSSDTCVRGDTYDVQQSRQSVIMEGQKTQDCWSHTYAQITGAPDVEEGTPYHDIYYQRQSVPTHIADLQINPRNCQRDYHNAQINGGHVSEGSQHFQYMPEQDDYSRNDHTGSHDSLDRRQTGVTLSEEQYMNQRDQAQMNSQSFLDEFHPSPNGHAPTTNPATFQHLQSSEGPQKLADEQHYQGQQNHTEEQCYQEQQNHGEKQCYQGQQNMAEEQHYQGQKHHIEGHHYQWKQSHAQMTETVSRSVQMSVHHNYQNQYSFSNMHDSQNVETTHTSRERYFPIQYAYSEGQIVSDLKEHQTSQIQPFQKECDYMRPIDVDAPPRSEDAQPRSEDAPPRSEDVPLRSEDIPPRSEDAPSKSEDAPSRSEDDPYQKPQNRLSVIIPSQGYHAPQYTSEHSRQIEQHEAPFCDTNSSSDYFPDYYPSFQSPLEDDPLKKTWPVETNSNLSTPEHFQSPTYGVLASNDFDLPEDLSCSPLYSDNCSIAANLQDNFIENGASDDEFTSPDTNRCVGINIGATLKDGFIENQATNAEFSTPVTNQSIDVNNGAKTIADEPETVNDTQMSEGSDNFIEAARLESSQIDDVINLSDVSSEDSMISEIVKTPMKDKEIQTGASTVPKIGSHFMNAGPIPNSYVPQMSGCHYFGFDHMSAANENQPRFAWHPGYFRPTAHFCQRPRLLTPLVKGPHLLASFRQSSVQHGCTRNQIKSESKDTPVSIQARSIRMLCHSSDLRRKTVRELLETLETAQQISKNQEAGSSIPIPQTSPDNMASASELVPTVASSSPVVNSDRVLNPSMPSFEVSTILTPSDSSNSEVLSEQTSSSLDMPLLTSPPALLPIATPALIPMAALSPISQLPTLEPSITADTMATLSPPAPYSTMSSPAMTATFESAQSLSLAMTGTFARSRSLTSLNRFTSPEVVPPSPVYPCSTPGEPTETPSPYPYASGRSETPSVVIDYRTNNTVHSVARFVPEQSQSSSHPLPLSSPNQHAPLTGQPYMQFKPYPRTQNTAPTSHYDVAHDYLRQTDREAMAMYPSWQYADRQRVQNKSSQGQQIDNRYNAYLPHQVGHYGNKVPLNLATNSHQKPGVCIRVFQPLQADLDLLPDDASTCSNHMLMKPRHFAFTSLQIGCFRYICPLTDCKKTSKMKLIFSQKKLVYEFQLNDTSDAYVTQLKQLTTVEIALDTIVRLWGRGRDLKLEVNAPPQMFLGSRTVQMEPKFGPHPATQYNRSRNLDLTGGQLLTYPYHEIHFNTDCVDRIKYQLRVYDNRFSSLLKNAFVEDPTKTLPIMQPTCSVQTETKSKLKRRRGRREESDSTSKTKKDTAGKKDHRSGCRCVTGCKTSRCHCCKFGIPCFGSCLCRGCCNPLNVLDQLGIPVEQARLDDCLVQNIYKQPYLEDVLRTKMSLPCCGKDVQIKHCIPGVFVCPNYPQCNGSFKYSWCLESFHDEKTSPRQHCMLCQKCKSGPCVHCNLCKSPYIQRGAGSKCPICNNPSKRQKTDKSGARSRTPTDRNTDLVIPKASSVAGQNLLDLVSVWDETPDRSQTHSITPDTLHNNSSNNSNINKAHSNVT